MNNELQEGLLFKYLNADDSTLYQNRAGRLINELTDISIDKFLLDVSELKTLLKDRNKLFDVAKKNTTQLTLDLGNKTSNDIIKTLFNLNQMILSKYIKLEYNSKILIQLFGEKHEYKLPDINNISLI